MDLELQPAIDEILSFNSDIIRIAPTDVFRFVAADGFYSNNNWDTHTDSSKWQAKVNDLRESMDVQSGLTLSVAMTRNKFRLCPIAILGSEGTPSASRSNANTLDKVTRILVMSAQVTLLI